MSARHRRGILVAALWAVNATACVPVTRFGPVRQEQGWPAYLGSPRHDAAAAETLNPDPRPLWRTDVGRAVRGSPALGESVIAVGVAERTLVLLDRASGELLWRQRVQGTIHAGPLLDEDRLYVATEQSPEGKVYAVRLRDGRPLWSTGTGSVAAPLAFDGQALFVGTEAGVVLRLETERGSPVWRRELPGGGAIRAAPVATPAGIAVATASDTLYLLDRETGAVLRRLATPGTVLGGPALDAEGSRLFLGTTEGHVLAVALPALEVRWDHRAGDAVYGAPAFVRDTLYVLARNGTLWLIPADDPAGARAHALDIVAVAGPTPVVPGVLVASVSGEVLLVDRVAGSVLWRAQVNGPIEEPPLLRDRQLVVAAGRGDIHTYR